MAPKLEIHGTSLIEADHARFLKCEDYIFSIIVSLLPVFDFSNLEPICQNWGAYCFLRLALLIKDEDIHFL